VHSDCRISIQFDNRGSKVMSKDAETKIIAALAKHVFMVPVKNVVRSTGMGQSSLVNHQVGHHPHCTHCCMQSCCSWQKATIDSFAVDTSANASL
jgi:hypothetical protein